jgi:DNA-binding beta-propeller fold protein YncE
LLLPVAALSVALILNGCTDESPDTSAPERIEIDRSADWQGALLYIADPGGPVEGWGSIRIYDNVSGFVEATVEQTFAASPSDVFVTSDGSKMYVSSMANGSVDIFFWDGNGWRRGTRTIETPTLSILAMDSGPDGFLYISGRTPDSQSGAIYKLDPSTDRVADEPIVIPELNEARGITWAAGGTVAFVTGTGPNGATLLQLDWPAATTLTSASLTVETVNQPLASPDGTALFIACRDQVLIADPTSGNVTGALPTTGIAGTDYYDVAFSADSRFLFAPGTAPEGGTTLYIFELETGDLVQEVTRVSVDAKGIERVE